MVPFHRRAWVEIDLGALLRNAETIARAAGVPLLPMIKADAYGLGAVAVARALERIDPWGYGVATIAEGEELRQAGIERPVLVFTPLLLDDLDAAERARLTPALGSAGSIRRWGGTGLPWHLAIDTGMSRAGVQWNEVAALRQAVERHPPQGAFTHFHSAQRDDQTRDRQEERFEEALRMLPARPDVLHAENSPALEYRGPSRWSVVRPGFALYGVWSRGPRFHTEAVVHLRARVVELRSIGDGESVSYDGTYRAVGRRRIATLAAGYGDGYRRALSNRGSAIIRGKRATVAGSVTMDMTMVDVTDIPCEVGDVATLIGRDGEELIEVAEVARAGDLSGYEVLTGLRGRLPRRYVGGEDA